MPQASDITAWFDKCCLRESGFGVALISALTTAIVLVLVVAFAPVIRRRFNRKPTRRWHVATMLGSMTGFVFLSGGFALYLSSSAWADIERFELYSAVFTGALVFGVSTIALGKLLGAFSLRAAARPGHHIVTLFAILLGGWLGYGFVTEQAQPFGLSALIAASALACAFGAHLTTSREYYSAHVLATGKRGLLSCIEWHDGEEPTWVLREITPGSVRAAAYRHRRDWHNSNNRSSSRGAAARARVCGRHRLTQFSTHCRP